MALAAINVQFPLPRPPSCLACGERCTRDTTRSNNNGNYGRPYYYCVNRVYHERKFSCFDDYRGLDPGNPRCWCNPALTSRRTTNNGSDFFTCAVGGCRFSRSAYQYQYELQEESQSEPEEEDLSRMMGNVSLTERAQRGGTASSPPPPYSAPPTVPPVHQNAASTQSFASSAATAASTAIIPVTPPPPATPLAPAPAVLPTYQPRLVFGLPASSQAAQSGSVPAQHEPASTLPPLPTLTPLPTFTSQAHGVPAPEQGIAAMMAAIDANLAASRAALANLAASRGAVSNSPSAQNASTSQNTAPFSFTTPLFNPSSAPTPPALFRFSDSNTNWSFGNSSNSNTGNTSNTTPNLFGQSTSSTPPAQGGLFSFTNTNNATSGLFGQPPFSPSHTSLNEGYSSSNSDHQPCRPKQQQHHSSPRYLSPNPGEGSIGSDNISSPKHLCFDPTRPYWNSKQSLSNYQDPASC
ncbi:hypothetical protein B0T17DRAFT_620770 [Bombardia bombarda]|uniref:GRF-like zinc ribbon domain-containing protein n=1 Tax=Bombardia bombarda TaxID=252184 RepID=A0AA39U7B6_9PEZI|nr:hypothetical protein B0T17DRAFT_620770 [Bombardia bombarda]